MRRRRRRRFPFKDRYFDGGEAMAANKNHKTFVAEPRNLLSSSRFRLGGLCKVHSGSSSTIFTEWFFPFFIPGSV